jgi:hypothetical protein
VEHLVASPMPMGKQACGESDQADSPAMVASEPAAAEGRKSLTELSTNNEESAN